MLSRESCPRLSSVSHATLSQSKRAREEQNFIEGVYTSSGKLVPESLCNRLSARNINLEFDGTALVEKAELTFEKGIYLGHLYPHYGHFLLETLSTFWVLDEIENKDDYTLFFHAASDSLIKKHAIAHVLRRLGISFENIVIVKEPTRVKELLVPERAFALGQSMHKVMKSVYSKIAVDKKPSRKLYLSRRYFTGSVYKKNCANEDEIEDLFKSYGFDIIYPEQLTFQRQLLEYASADVIAGIEGTALHNVLLASDKIRCITLGSPTKPHVQSANQTLCNDLKRIDSHFVPFKGEVLETAYEYNIASIERVISKLFTPKYSRRVNWMLCR